MKTIKYKYNFNRRKQLVKFWSTIKNILLIIAGIILFFGLMIVNDNLITIIPIVFDCILAFIAYIIERYCILNLCKDDIRLNTVFYHPDFDEYSDYYDWLHDYHLKDTDENYNEYLSLD